jgi:C_GCAxxG_C_C family probable redox protein
MSTGSAGEVSKEELLNRIEQTAYGYERDHHGCSQCVLLSLQEHLKIGNEATFRAASPLAAGVALMGDSCGALLGGMMALGLAFGREKVEDFGALAASALKARALYERFRQEFGSCLCREVMAAQLGRFYDLATEYEAFQQAGGYEHCPRVVGKTARMAAELILAEGG